ncbi:hypothetical protein [Bacillus xiamenensis]|uniref:hypothetical protein n=1 Tax=Bacillus xiamenensis TaxID=1178537 RepID=UPI002221BD70|nr:hypothetical protein [Bacillus xiamenensis]MCW1837926.1 hypothetical protein [Bacillus xiamenensis]
MSTLEVFRQFLVDHYPSLQDELWLKDVDTLRISPILHPFLKRKLPEGIEKFTCVLFTQQTDQTDAPLKVYLLLDEHEQALYAIDLMNEQIVLH